MQDERKTTAEELKSLIRKYADENFPGWACAGLSMRIGEIGASVTETLITLSSDEKEKQVTQATAFSDSPPHA